MKNEQIDDEGNNQRYLCLKYINKINNANTINLFLQI